MVAIQMDFWKSFEQCEIDALRLRLAKVESSCDKVRKGMYARLNQQAKELEEIKTRMGYIEQGICYGK